MFCAKKSLVVLAALGMLLFLAAPALAHWNEGDPNTKWVQYPDLTPFGLDVKVTSPLILADDWKCEDPRPVTDIHLWGSWKNDLWPTTFFPDVKVQIWSDQPATAADYSRPSEFLWEATDYNWTLREYYQFPDDKLCEGWYDPLENVYLPNNDRVVWQLNLDLTENPFYQVEGEIYWLVVQASFLDGTQGYELGWKTSRDHWNDDAVWAYGDLGDPTGVNLAWQELRYPDGHEYEGQSIDLSFVITVPEPGTLALLATAGLGLLLYAWRRRK